MEMWVGVSKISCIVPVSWNVQDFNERPNQTEWTLSIFAEDRLFLLIYLISLSSLKQNSLNQDFRSSNLKIHHWQTEILRTQENMQLVKQRLRQIISKEQKNQLRKKTIKQKNCETRQISNWSRQEHFFTHHKPELLTETNKRYKNLAFVWWLKGTNKTILVKIESN